MNIILREIIDMESKFLSTDHDSTKQGVERPPARYIDDLRKAAGENGCDKLRHG